MGHLRRKEHTQLSVEALDHLHCHSQVSILGLVSGCCSIIGVVLTFDHLKEQDVSKMKLAGWRGTIAKWGSCCIILQDDSPEQSCDGVETLCTHSKQASKRPAEDSVNQGASKKQCVSPCPLDECIEAKTAGIAMYF